MIKKASLKHELIEKNQGSCAARIALPPELFADDRRLPAPHCHRSAAFRTVNSRVTELMNQKTSLESEIRREMPQALGEVRSEQNKSTQHLQTLETEAAAEKMVSEAKTLRSICEMYSQRLGLDLIKLPEGRVQFEFTQVDSKRPERVFLFQIKLDENKRYVVPNCEPKLPNLDDMVQLLNARDARGAKGLFGWFVQAMRREFCKIVATAPESDDAANESVDEISHIYG